MVILKRVGVIADNIETWYEAQIFSGIKKMASEKNINILTFCGNQLSSDKGDESGNNAIYNLINTANMDGIIILAGNLFNYTDKDEKKAFLKRFENIPVVGISVPLRNIPSVVFDNNKAVEMILEHLITKHNYKKFAYISGPNINSEAEIRYKTFINVMEKHNISINPDYIYKGDYFENSGKAAAEYFLSKKKIMPDVIVAASDEMAIGAMQRLQEMGIRVPSQIAVTGFDNFEKAKMFTPPLTTVKQPVYQMGCLSVKLMDKILNGEQVPLETHIGGELVVRESCGCFQIMSEAKDKGFHKNDADEKTYDIQNKLRKALIIEKESFIKKINTAEDDIKGLDSKLDRLLIYFLDDIKNRRLKGEFLSYLNSFVNDTITGKTLDFPWYKLLYEIGESTEENVNDVSLILLSKDILNLSNILVSNVLHRKEMLNQYYLEKMYIKLRMIISEFNSVFSINDLKKTVKKAMEYFEIKNYFLCLYDGPVKHSPVLKFQVPEIINLITGNKQGVKFENIIFNSEDILPSEIINDEIRGDYVFYPLFSADVHYGYVVFGSDVNNNYIYESIREQISLSLRNQMMYQERKRAEEKLGLAIIQLGKYNEKLHILSAHDELTMLYNRRGFYKYGEIRFRLAENSKEKFTLFYADMDYFKEINDTYGHQAGDEAIKAAALCIKKSLRNDDIISRIGGDEFAMIVHDASQDAEIKKILKRIKINFDSYNLNSKRPYKISISIGYAVFKPDMGISFDDLIRAADSELYKEKNMKRSDNKINR